MKLYWGVSAVFIVGMLIGMCVIYDRAHTSGVEEGLHGPGEVERGIIRKQGYEAGFAAGWATATEEQTGLPATLPGYIPTWEDWEREQRESR